MSRPLIPQVGDIVNERFRVDRALGMGGFSAVFEATQINLGRQVALKMMLPEILGDSYNISLFRREAQFAKNLRHPYIIELYDYGETERRLPFIVMELLKGEALADALGRSAMDEQRLWQVSAQVLKALMAAHRQGVVHRDIKPSNIFLCQYSGMDDFVKVIDFGIAKALTGPGESTQTVSGKLTGTPAYMAPEQIHGHNQGPHTDLYALGLVMAEALTGQPIFGPHLPMIEVLKAQSSTAPVPLPGRVRDSRLGAIIEKATAKDLSQRYRSADAMLADIEQVQFGRINLPSVSFSSYVASQVSHGGGAPREGDLINHRYQIDAKLSVRPHHALYQATQLSLERKVAIKVLLPEAARRQNLVEAFKREVNIGRTLSNPHAVQILDYGETQTGLPYFVMEWLRGFQLSAILKNVRLMPEQVVQVAMQALYALRDGHRQGIIHEDIRPSNIFLCDVGLDTDFVKLTDFGRPGNQVSDRDGMVRLTDTDEVLGAPHYMAPEQLVQGRVGPHSDLYALGLVMAEALTGHSIYSSKLDPIVVARQQASDAPAPIPDYALAGHLGAVIERATRKEQALRYVNADEMLADLKLIASQQANAPVQKRLTGKAKVVSKTPTPSRQQPAVRGAAARPSQNQRTPTQPGQGPPSTGGFRAIERPTLAWRVPTGSYIRSAPVLAPDGTIYVGSFDKHLYAIYPNGQPRWRFKTQGELRSSPARGADGTIYTGSRDARVYALTPQGKQRWAYETVGPITASPIISPNGVVYVGSGDRYFYALDARRGAPLWFVATDGPISSTPTLGADGTIYIGSEDHHLYAVDDKGHVKWRVRTGGRIYGSPAINRHTGMIYVGSEDEYLYAINHEGEVVWGFEMEFFFASTPVIDQDGTIYIGANDGTLYALSPHGHVKWTFKANDAVVAPPSLDTHGNIYLGANDGTLYAINPQGQRRWVFEIGDWIQSTPVISPKGHIFFGADDGYLYAVQNQ